MYERHNNNASTIHLCRTRTYRNLLDELLLVAQASDRGAKSRNYQDTNARDGRGEGVACGGGYKSKRMTSVKQLRALVRSNPTPHVVARVMATSISVRLSQGKNCYKNIQRVLSLTDLERFLESVWTTYMVMHELWRINNFSLRFMPTLDRRNPKGHYETGNLQITSYGENASRAQLGIPKSKNHRKKLSKIHAGRYRGKPAKNKRKSFLGKYKYQIN